MDPRFLYQKYLRAGLPPPPVIFMVAPPGQPQKDMLDEPMALSLADQVKIGVHHFGGDEFCNEQVQRQMRVALERMHSQAENWVPDAQDPFTHAFMVRILHSSLCRSWCMSQDLAQSPIPDVAETKGDSKKYSPQQRQMAVQRWMAKRKRRHLTSKTKYVKMQDVAIGKARCVGGKFVKKTAQKPIEEAIQMPLTQMAVAEPVTYKDRKDEDPAWQSMYDYYAQAEI